MVLCPGGVNYGVSTRSTVSLLDHSGSPSQDIAVRTQQGMV